ncbi:protein spaetzle-like isoform X2 [Zootermopsis nevadensis]|uniref:Protein spaetzle n=2 Tax=Zootermopsis nevadensis TaxID=136037 RepID=A0A067R2D2_ZOONE|nr:protein spaetzle-like isoform X2 [Zootermopsis nevadensis]XP_021924360.1 protein spaetzle-like isoform X2 [Zootermopsis nevadensis]KDR17073.1 Protein spaetzle [Zootermopsis nevadensis]
MDTSEESKIVFPGQQLSNTVANFTPQLSGRQPTCADESGICENADNYPQDYVRRLFLKNVTNSYAFGTDLMDINLRINPDEEVSLCPSMEQVVYPKMAQSKDDKWLFVINQDTYIQGIRIEKCARQGSCTFAENFPSGYTTSCQQKYVYRKLLALGEDGKPVTDSFRLPSCCSCVVTKSYRSRRMARDTGRSQIPSRRTRRRK